MDQQNPTLAKFPILDTEKFKQRQFKIQQYLQHEHYALWEVIKFGDSYEVPVNVATTGSTSDETGKKKGRTVTLTTEDMQKRKNDVKARTTLLLSLPNEHQLRFNKYKTTQELWAAILKTFSGNEATKKTKKNLLKQQYGNFKAEGSETLEQTFNKLQVIIGQLQFMDVEIEQDDLNQKFLTSLAPEWLMHTIVWRNRSDLDTMSLDDLYNHLKVYKSEVQKKLKPNSQNMAFISSAKHSRGNEEVNTASVSTASTNVPTASANIRDWSYMVNDEENHALIADEETPTEFTLMAKTSGESEVFDNSFCSKACKKNFNSLNIKITELTDKLCDAKNMTYHYKLALAQVESRLAEHKSQELKYYEKIRVLKFNTESRENCIESLTKDLELLKKEKGELETKLTGFQTALKDLDSLFESQRLDKNKEGLGYSAVPPPAAQIYSPAKKDMSWTGLLECVDDTITDYSRPAPTIESSASDETGKTKGRTVTLTTEDMQKRKNDVKARTTLLLSLPNEHQLRFSKYKTTQELWAAILKTFGGNEATKKTKKNLLKQQCGNFKVEGSKTLEQTFNKLQVIIGQLQFMDIEIEQDDLNQKFLTSLAPKWLMHTIVWRNRSDLDTMSLDDMYNHLKVYKSEVQKKLKPNSQNIAFISSAKHSRGNEEVNTASVSTASTNVPTASANIRMASISQDTACAYITSQSSGSQIKFEDINQIDKDDMEEMDIKWNMALLSMRVDRFWKKTERKISIQGTDMVGFDKSKDWSYMANDEENHALIADEETPIEFTLMAKTSVESEVFDNSFCSKACFQTASKDLDSLLESQRLDKNKEELGYSVVPPPPAQIYSPAKKDMSNVRGNQRNWNNLKSHQLGPNFVMEKKACFNCGDFNHLAYDCRKRAQAGNISYLSDYEPFDRGYVSFGQGGCKITGKGITKTGKLDFENVYFVKDLKLKKTKKMTKSEQNRTKTGSNKGETIHDYYVRFAKLINDMRNIKMTMSRMQWNSKFVNNMLPEYGRFVTAVKVNRGASGYEGAQNRVENANPGQARQIKCYNCNDKTLLMQAQENRVALHEEQLLFIAGGQDNDVDEDVDEQPVQDLALKVDNFFQADDCDAFNSDVDEAPTTQTMFMANLSSIDPVYDEASPSYDSDILSKVPDHDNYQDVVCEHHEVHEMHDDVQPNYIVNLLTDYASDSNMTPYDQMKHDEIEQKNLLIANDNLIADCLSKDVFYTATDYVLIVSRFSYMHEAFNAAQKPIAELESENSNLENKIQNDDHARAKTIEKTNSLSTEVANLKAQIKENHKSNCVTMPTVKLKVLAHGMYVRDVEPIPPRNRNNRKVNLDYLKHLKESVATLCEIIKELGLKNH
nr:hypothetical protein [Tanacetum cinerariifolium]